MSEMLEAIMMLTFGAAWPTSIVRSYRARTARGKSLGFLLLIELGYLSGMLGKFVSGAINYVLIFYAINAVAVMVELILYFRNRKLDSLAIASSG